ncbi:TPA: hypothetical protein ACH3X2_009739 [Trebouxia sp. C0005]
MSREEVSTEELMSVAKNMAKGQGVEDSNFGDGLSYNDGSERGEHRDSYGQQTGYGDVSEQGVYNDTSIQQNNYDNGYGQQASDVANAPQQGGYEDVSDSAQQGGYEDVSNQQTGYEDVSGHQGGYEDVSEQQNGYSSGTGTMVNTDASTYGGNEYGNNQNSLHAGSPGNSARQGMQAQGRGFGQGFNAGFGQGLSGDSDGSQPHKGVTVQEEIGPDSASRDTDLHTTGGAQGGGFETHQHHRDSFTTKSYVHSS